MHVSASPSASSPWPARLLAVAVGIGVGGVGTLFRVGAEQGYAAWATLLRAGPPLPLPRWIIGAAGSAALVVMAVWLTRRLSPESAGSGIQEIEGALDGSRPELRWRRILPVKFFGGLCAITSGLILGREGPTIHIGGALGAALASVSTRTRQYAGLLIGAGSAAGLSVAFNAPFGGFLFAMEELRREFPLDSRRAQCVMLATIAATLVSLALTGPVLIVPIPIYASSPMSDIVLVVPFAMGVGLYGVFLNAALVRALDAVRALVARVGWFAPALLLGAGIGLLVCVLPDVTGGGEMLTVRLVESPDRLAPLLALLVLRTVVFNLSYSGGTPGGIFAPQLAFGTILGLLFAGVVSALAPGWALEPGRFAVAGMAALLTATVRAPLTGLALVLEMTGNYALLPMALVACAVADLTADALGGRPIYEVLLERALRQSAARARAQG